MNRRSSTGIWWALAFLCICSPAFAQAPVVYHVSFPDAGHHRMQVDVTFAEVPPQTLEVIMSRTSPGRASVIVVSLNSPGFVFIGTRSISWPWIV